MLGRHSEGNRSEVDLGLKADSVDDALWHIDGEGGTRPLIGAEMDGDDARRGGDLEFDLRRPPLPWRERRAPIEGVAGAGAGREDVQHPEWA